MHTSSNLPYLWKTVCTTRNCYKLAFFVKNVKKTSTRINILKILPSAYEKKKAQLQIDLHWFVWSIISNKLRFAVLDKTCAKQSAQLVCCSKSNKANHTAQLSFCLKFAPIVEKQNLVQNTVRNYRVARNWCQNTLAKLSFGLKFTPCVKKAKNCSNPSATVNYLKFSC